MTLSTFLKFLLTLCHITPCLYMNMAAILGERY